MGPAFHLVGAGRLGGRLDEGDRDGGVRVGCRAVAREVARAVRVSAVARRRAAAVAVAGGPVRPARQLAGRGPRAGDRHPRVAERELARGPPVREERRVRFGPARKPNDSRYLQFECSGTKFQRFSLQSSENRGTRTNGPRNAGNDFDLGETEEFEDISRASGPSVWLSRGGRRAGRGERREARVEAVEFADWRRGPPAEGAREVKVDDLLVEEAVVVWRQREDYRAAIEFLVLAGETGKAYETAQVPLLFPFFIVPDVRQPGILPNTRIYELFVL